MLAVVLCCVVLSVTVEIVHGGYQYRPELQRSVAQKKVIATWEEANHICETEGAVLASPIDVALFNYMSSVIGVNNHTVGYFTGVKARYNSDNYKEFASIEGILVDDMPAEVINMIEYLEPLNGDCLSMSRYSINVMPCHARLPYICYKSVKTPSEAEPTEPAIRTTESTTLTTETNTTIEITTLTTAAPTTTTERSICLTPGYTYYIITGACYKHHDHPRVWHDARQVCRSEGGDLVVLNNQEEADIIYDIITPLSSLSLYYITWVGLSDEFGYGDWRTVNGVRWDQIYSYSFSNGPKSSDNGRCCAANINGKRYEYLSCNTQYYFICEKRVF